jgi:anti-sigma regulatory factor (Ser/Thr protein kinase)
MGRVAHPAPLRGVLTVRSELTLEPVPTAARTARHWVTTELADSARSEFTDSAVLGVSELVTNAILHVRSPIVVRLLDDDERLRVEVCDDSQQPPHVHLTLVNDEQRVPSTIGRGLSIVDSISHSWGVSYDEDGKCVWFLPAPYGVGTGSRATRWDSGPRPDVVTAGDHVTVTLIDVPLKVFVHYRERFSDLQRELALIALDEHDASQLAKRLIDVAEQTADFRREGTGISARVEAALRSGADRATITVDVPRELGPALRELNELLEKVNAICQDEQLLTLAAGPQEQALRAWYLGELSAQIDGAAPSPWPGDLVVTDPQDGAN